MSDVLLNVLRAIANGAESHTDPTSYAVWVHSVVTEVLNGYEPTMPVYDDADGLDESRVSLVTSILSASFNPFGDKPLVDADAASAFQSYLRRAAARIVRSLPADTTPAWYDLSSAPADGTPVLLLNARNGDQAIARLLPVSGEEPCWIFAQGFTNEGSQVSFRFENPTHWQPVRGDIPYMEPEAETEVASDPSSSTELETGDGQPLNEVEPAYAPVFVPEVPAESSPSETVPNAMEANVVEPFVDAHPIQAEDIIQLAPDEPTP